jgi:hypothetical protein
MKHVAPTERGSLFYLAGYKHFAPLERDRRRKGTIVFKSGCIRHKRLAVWSEIRGVGARLEMDRF